ncbi:MAG: hypothetical protein HWQ35_34380 [Nostoc sp. NMS1]|nr:hypothetical protein [Nostoc sp. NMS1]MBN3911443.1 hypothetical protein [Nostoc sp. NMS1]
MTQTQAEPRARVAMEQECTLSPKSLLALHSRQRQSEAITRIASDR